MIRLVNAGISAHPNGVTTVSNGQYKGRGLDDLYKNEKHLFGNPTDDVFPLLTKILDADDWLSVQVHPDDSYGLAHEGNWARQNVGTFWKPKTALKSFMVTMPNPKKNSVSKSKLEIGTSC